MITIDKNNIEGITLLSIGNIAKLPTWLLANGTIWWLQTPGYLPHDVAFVNCAGSYDASGACVNDNNVCVRPAIKIDVRPYLPLVIGETVLVLGREAQFVGNGMVLFCEPIDHRKFDNETNNFNKSELKEYLEGWLKKEMEK